MSCSDDCTARLWRLPVAHKVGSQGGRDGGGADGVPGQGRPAGGGPPLAEGRTSSSLAAAQPPWDRPGSLPPWEGRRPAGALARRPAPRRAGEGAGAGAGPGRPGPGAGPGRAPRGPPRWARREGGGGCGAAATAAPGHLLWSFLLREGERGRSRPASGGRGAGILGSRGDSRRVRARGPGLSPDPSPRVPQSPPPDQETDEVTGLVDVAWRLVWSFDQGRGGGSSGPNAS